MAKTVDQFSTIEDFRQKYNELAVDVGDSTGLRTSNSSTIVDAVNSIEDKSFFFQEYVYIATAAQTAFSGNDSFSNSLRFRANRIQVFKNSVHLNESSDYSISGPVDAEYSVISLTSAASAGDKVTIYSFTGSYLGTAANSDQPTGHFTETASNTIYNTNTNGVILNGDGTPYQTSVLESGYTIQLAGKTFAEDDILLTTGKTLTAPRITDGTALITGAVGTAFTSFTSTAFHGTTADLSGTVTANNFTIGNASINEGELETIDGVTAGTVSASKAVVVDSVKDITGFRNVTLTGELDAVTLDISGNGDIAGTLGVTGVATVGGITIGAAVITEAELETIDTITAGTVTASKAVVVDSSKDITGFRNVTLSGELDALSLDIGTGGADINGTLETNVLSLNGVSVTASAVELNYVDGTTLGTAVASKLIGVDANKDITGLRNLTITGDLTVSGTTTTINSETINLADNIILLNSNFDSGTPTEDSGFSVRRGGSATKSLFWDESATKWTVGSETFVAATFEGALTGNVTGNVSGTSGSTTGNALTATTLQTARNIGGVSFNGSAAIDLPGVNTSGTQDTSGTAANATLAAGMTTLASVSDVSHTGIAIGKVLGWSGSTWAPIDQSTSTDSVTEGSYKYFTDGRVNDVIISGAGLTKSYVADADAGSDTSLDGRTTLNIGDGDGIVVAADSVSVGEGAGITVNTNDIALDYETVSSAPTVVGGTATGHLWFVI